MNEMSFCLWIVSVMLDLEVSVSDPNVCLSVSLFLLVERLNWHLYNKHGANERPSPLSGCLSLACVGILHGVDIVNRY